MFVFGTGQSGTTHFQRMITMHSSTWVWGEHQGILAPLSGSVRRFEKSEVLVRNKAIRKGKVATDGKMADKPVATRGPSLSWLNRLSSGTLRSGSRSCWFECLVMLYRQLEAGGL